MISSAQFDGISKITSLTNIDCCFEDLSTRRSSVVKRLFDISISLAIVGFCLPLMMIVYMITALDGGQAIYAHKRIGRHGKEFPCYKFRSMRKNSDLFLAQLIATDPQIAEEWQQSRKLKVDPRITRWGHFMRKSSLDELPQLFNVLFGDMSLVGPRPVTHDELDRYGENAIYYLSVRPGITGQWQVSGRSMLDYDRRVLLDIDYVKNLSLGRDIYILVKTFFVVIKQRGAC